MRIVILFFVTVAIAIFSVLALVTSADSHEWYDADCCDNKDCAPVTAIKRHRSNRGWIMSTKFVKDVFVPDNMSSKNFRYSKNHQTHMCHGDPAEYGHPAAETGFDKPYVRCVYWAPMN